jgi:hypothetical protein
LKKCFIISPIGQDGSPTRKRSDQVFRHIIEPVCLSNGYTPVRVDQINDTDSINQTIINHLVQSELVISDLTDHNPNAFYETGYRLALGKPLIQLIEEGQNLPFDVAGTRTIFYNLLDLDKVSMVKDKLTETIKTVTMNSDRTNSENHDIKHNPEERDSRIFSLLLDIKDSIQNLKTEIVNKDKKDTEQMISVLVKQLNSNNFNPEMKAMEIMLTEFIKNPESMKNFMSIAELTNKQLR